MTLDGTDSNKIEEKEVQNNKLICVLLIIDEQSEIY
jgi:hypothetical protein